MSRIVVAALLVAWPLVGLGASYVMRRRGHDLFSWSLLGAFLGPLVVPLAVDHARHAEQRSRALVEPGVRAAGAVDVLVGLDGSPESEAALQRAVELFGDRLGRLTLATVVDYEALDPRAADASVEVRERAQEELHRQATRYAAHGPGAELLSGRPATALAEEALRGGYDVLAVGARGRSASRAALGSTSARLVRECAVPLLLAGPAARVAAAA